MLRSDIPKVLFSSIKEDDPHRASKLFQIERWCYANWRLHQKSGKKGRNFLAQVLSSEDCWKKVDNLHGVKLDRQMVGKKLIVQNSNSPFSTDKRYEIACRYCLEEDIIALFEERKNKLSAQGKSSLLEYGHLVKTLGGNLLIVFWSHFVSGYISKLNLDGCHPYEYGLKCAVSLKQEQAVEFFWNKIKSLPESEMSEQKKDEILMKTAVYVAGNRCNSYPEIFEFCFSQVNPDKYPELLKRDLAENGYYGSLNTLQGALRFDQFQRLFSCLKPSSISEDYYYIWLKYIKELENYSRSCIDEGVNLFMYMWMRDGFNSHRTLLLNKEMRSNSVFQGRLLVPLIDKGYMVPVWAILDKANPDQIKEFMDSRQAEYIRSVLEKRDIDSLNKFLSYAKFINEEFASLTEVKLSKVCEQLELGN
ncbi:hypothetical protein [Wolbachia endosymbiont (group A) of Epagoge grotiana]|uniref:hypothetical protein n=1 Tax=Wolbachia endosymbiont (group A) of Epagoge grotiana TaxID=2954006 RepID=UPI00223044A5|nr:hypothetical protein [Wolbachia endosymbiont (group A) of Epagoge grotiana]